jgi:hypothetical protein
MSISKIQLGFLIAIGGLVIGGCSAKSDGTGANGGFLGGAGTGSMPGGGQAGQTPFGGGTGFPGNPGLPGAGGGGPVFNPGTVHKPDGGVCNAITQTPETVVVYKDASFTDTITTYKPVALFIMQDRSSSMVTGMPAPASAQSWDNSTGAITAFVNDPRVAGIDIGLGTFPSGPNNTYDCNTGSDCGTPVVPIAALPNNGGAMINAMQSQRPSNGGLLNPAFTPTECGLRGMINTCLQFMAQSPVGEQCVAILVTDGTPTQCSQDQTVLQKIVADGHAAGVTTFTLGLPGSDLNALNALAAAGGTNAAIDVSGGSQAFIDALNNIRQAVAVTTTTSVTTTSVVSTPLPCKWKIPPVQAPQVFDPKKVNVQFTPPGGAIQQFGHVDTAADCARVGGDAWYYDNNAAPTQVLACPQSCSGTLKNSAGAQVQVLLGCDTIQAVPH